MGIWQKVEEALLAKQIAELAELTRQRKIPEIYHAIDTIVRLRGEAGYEIEILGVVDEEPTKAIGWNVTFAGDPDVKEKLGLNLPGVTTVGKILTRTKKIVSYCGGGATTVNDRTFVNCEKYWMDVEPIEQCTLEQLDDIETCLARVIVKLDLADPNLFKL